MMAETLINARETAGLKINNSLRNSDTENGSRIPSFRTEDEASKKSITPERILNATTDRSFATSSNSAAIPTSFVNSSSEISQSNNIAVDDPSWLEGLLNEEMEINSEKEIGCEEIKKSRSHTNKTFMYCYITDTGTESNDQNDAEIDIEKSVCYLVGCLLGKLSLGAVGYLVRGE